MNEEQKKTSYFKHYDEFYGIIKPLSEVQLGMLTEALAIYRGFQLNERTLEELLSDPAVQIAFNAYKISIDKGDRAYENKCAANRENGKKGGRPKKKRPEPELEPEEVAEDLTDEVEPVPDPDPEPDREPVPGPFAILKPIERRAAEIVLHENDFDFLDRFDTKQLDELFTFAVLSEYNPGELAAAAQEADSVLNAAREKAESLYKSRNEEKWFIPDFAFILDKLNELRQLPAEELETACQKFDERTETA